MPILGDVVPGRKLHVSLFAAFFLLAISQTRGASFSSSSSTLSSLPLSLSSLLAGASGSSSSSSSSSLSSSSLQSSKKIPIIRLETHRYPHFKEGPSNHHLHHHEQIKSKPFLLLQKRDPQANGLSLSITNNMDVLRSKFLRELIQRRENKLRQNWVRNQELLDDIGKKRK
ncbi:putative uncharacterized protein DDB_G0277255 isoform X2 [Tigriopus californicus]|nr:putative uncharacterized protein DDB_G0277255 isoform X2 [Tigriopus californicus]